MIDRKKYSKSPKFQSSLHYKNFSPLQHPVLQPIFISVGTYSRLIRSPTPSARFEEPIIERTSINQLISYFSGIDTPLSMATNETISDEDLNSNNTEGFALDRFTEEIDNFFKCPFCKKIVKKPQECIYCQNLMCKACVSNVFKCPYGCDALQVNQPSKFALISYMKLKIKCIFAASGCEYIGRIKDISEHEKDCDYSEVKCINPVCDVVFLKKQRPLHGPVICSEICNLVLNYKNILESKSEEEHLQEFVKIIENAKGSIHSELKSDLEELMNQAQEKKNEVEEFLKAKEDLYADIEEWRNYYHSGKWNNVIKWWNCCEVKEKFSKGCTLIG